MASSPAARRHRYERRLRSIVRRDRGCLESLPSTAARLLGLRAGLSGEPRSRSEAAAELGISSRRAARLERRGLLELRLECGEHGSSAGAASARIALLAAGAPALQPVGFLAVAASPTLEVASDLGNTGKRGRQAVKDTTASSGNAGGGATEVPLAASSAPLGDEGAGSPAIWLVLAALTAGLAALLLVALRTRREPSSAAATRSSASVLAPPPPPATRVTAPPPAAEAAAPHPPGFVSPPPLPGRPAVPIRDRPTPTKAHVPIVLPPTAHAPTVLPPTARSETAPARPQTPPAWSPQTPARPQTPPPRTLRGDLSRLARPASAVASGIVSLAVREYLRRRRRR